MRSIFKCNSYEDLLANIEKWIMSNIQIKSGTWCLICYFEENFMSNNAIMQIDGLVCKHATKTHEIP